MKLYIAGSSNELNRAELWMGRAKEAGIEVTQDWVTPIREKGSGNDLPFLEKRKFAIADRDAIWEAEAFWFLVPQGVVSFGATWEFGFAAARRFAAHVLREEEETSEVPMPVVLSGSRSNTHIFMTLADMSFERDEDAFEYLLRQCMDV